MTIFLGMAGALSRRRPAADRRASDRATATSTASSRPARTSITICTRRAASTTTSARAHADDAALAEDRIDRVYDTYASEEEFIGNDNWIADFAATLEHAAVHHARVPLPARRPSLEDDRARRHPDRGLSRQRADFLPGASPIRRSAWACRRRGRRTPGAGYIDIIGDIVESANLIIRRPRTASVVLGGGTPKNFINQASVQAEFYSDEVGGHRYALQIVTDVPHFGGASGSSLEEAQSWGKLATDSRARCRCRPTRRSRCRSWRARSRTTAPPLLADAQDAGVHPGRRAS